MKQNVVIVGLGLLGSSIALNLKKNKERFQVFGVSSLRTTIAAENQNLVDKTFVYDNFQWASSADVVILCTPIKHILSFLEKLSKQPGLKPNLILSDVGSTKQQICDVGQKLFPQTQGLSPIFVGGHPMAGSEKSGIDAQEATLFENTFWLVTPPEGIEVSRFENLSAIVECCGAREVILKIEDHDKIVAKLSHSPQIISSALAASIFEQKDMDLKNLELAGRGFRDMTRIAASSFPMWESIFDTNRKETILAIEQFQATLERFKKGLEKLDSPLEGDFQDTFENGAELRSKVSTPGKGFSEGLFEMIVSLEDRPGMISQLVVPLSEENINIRDIELLKVREGVQGTLLLAFSTESEAQRAKSILEACDIHCVLRS